MLCRALSALAIEKDSAGFELPIRKANAKAWNIIRRGFNLA
jgi:hypothetical protein